MTRPTSRSTEYQLSLPIFHTRILDMCIVSGKCEQNPQTKFANADIPEIVHCVFCGKVVHCAVQQDAAEGGINKYVLLTAMSSHPKEGSMDAKGRRVLTALGDALCLQWHPKENVDLFWQLIQPCGVCECVYLG